MKKTLLFFLLFFCNITFSQIIEGDGIYDLDSCNFENTFSMIKLDTSMQNIWQIGQPSKQVFNSSYSYENALITDSLSPYPIARNSYFDVVLPNSYGPNLIISFKHRFHSDTLIDGGYIECSYDMGETWTNVVYDFIVNHPDDFRSENLYTEYDTLKGGIPGFSGSSSSWIETKLQWVFFYPVKANYADTFLLRFHFMSDSVQTNKDGWIIDDFLISYADFGSGISELDASNIQLFPNPTNNKLNFEKEISGQYKICDLSGRIVFEGKLSGQELDVQALQEGMYVFYLESKEKTYKTFFVKEN